MLDIHSNKDLETLGKTNATFVPQLLSCILGSFKMLCVKSSNIFGSTGIFSGSKSGIAARIGWFQDHIVEISIWALLGSMK